MDEISRLWGGLPDKPLFLALLGTWLLFFQFLGNSTLGYVDTHSLYAWMSYTYSTSKDDELGYIIPLIVLGLCYWKRDELLAAPKRTWWPAFALVAIALAIHLVGYVIQQARVSIGGFYLGIYALTGVVWGPSWLRVSFFPCLLFAFGVPVGTMAETVTVPLSHIASDITGWICGTLLGIDIIQEGVQISDSQRRYTYAIGSNKDAAVYAGIPVSFYTVAVYTISGMLCGLAAMIEASRLMTGQPTAGQGYELQVIAAVVIGGGSLTGGEGSVIGTVIGAFIMGLLANGSGLLGIAPYLQPALIGGIIIFAVALDEARKRRFT